MISLSTAGKRSIDEYLDKLELDLGAPPLVFGATTSKGEIYLRGVGNRRANDADSGVVDGDTAFWVCSEGKLITHLAAAQLIERGHLSLDTPVSDFFPEFSSCVVLEGASSAEDQRSENGVDHPTLPAPYRLAERVITIEHLMHHTSGLFYSGSSPEGWDSDINNPYTFPQDPEDPVGEFLRWIKGNYPGIPLKFEPGTSWAYGWSSDILGFVVEKASGTTLEDYFQTNIFKPLSMTRSSFYRTPSINENVVSISYRREESDAFEPWEHRYYEVDPTKVHLLCGGAHLISSSRDYLAFLRHLLQILTSDTPTPNPLISRDALLRFFRPSLNPSGQGAIQTFLQANIPPSATPSVQWANGQAITTEDWAGRRRSGSGFWMGFLNLIFWIDPTRCVAAVLQAQYLPPLDGRLDPICEELERRLYEGLVETGGASNERVMPY